MTAAACSCRYPDDEIIRVVAFIGDDVIHVKAFDQGRCLRDVVGRAAGQDKTQAVAQAVHGNVQLG